VLVTSYPDKIHEALAASLAVLRDIGDSPITPRELMRAKRTLLTRWVARRHHVGMMCDVCDECDVLRQ
jgi:hypothetical protein